MLDCWEAIDEVAHVLTVATSCDELHAAPARHCCRPWPRDSAPRSRALQAGQGIPQARQRLVLTEQALYDSDSSKVMTGASRRQDRRWVAFIPRARFGNDVAGCELSLGTCHCNHRGHGFEDFVAKHEMLTFRSSVSDIFVMLHCAGINRRHNQSRLCAQQEIILAST